MSSINRILIVSVITVLALIGCKKSVSNVNGNTNNNCNSANVDTTNVTGIVDSLTNGQQSLGVNYNGQFDHLNINDLHRTRTKWVRGFIDFFQLYSNPDTLKTDPQIINYLKLNDNGFNTILNIKWNFHNKDFPSNSSATMRNYESFLKKLLDKVWSKTDIIVVGNEPFIEAKNSEKGTALVQFYEEIAKYIRAYETGALDNNGCTNGNNSTSHVSVKPVFIGAFNNLYENSWQTSAVVQLLNFTKSENWIAGIDMHIHHSSFNQLSQALNYVNGKIRSDQKIIITEFSMVKYFQSYMNNTIPSSFAGKYGYDSTMVNYQYINQTLHNPVSRKEWVGFLSNSNWFESKKTYVSDAFNLFTTYRKFAIATYGLRQSYPYNKDFTSNTMPWILNSIYANRTVRPDSTGQNQFNYAWIQDFLAVQNGTYN
ncbi:MAG TPA: hypothetical protein VJ991_16435 [Balneolales bacterium]|nr:hypothetical protein [Balneolales bacterium]